MNRTEKIVITCTILVFLGFAKIAAAIKEVYSFTMTTSCKSDMIAAEVSKLDRGIAVDLYPFTNGRSSKEMRDLPQCKGAK